MRVIITDHYWKRFRQRQAKTSRIELFTERAFRYGKEPSKYNYKMYAKMLTKKESMYNSVAKVYNGFVYWFVGNRAITIYPVPRRFRERK